MPGLDSVLIPGCTGVHVTPMNFLYFLETGLVAETQRWALSETSLETTSFNETKRVTLDTHESRETCDWTI